MNGHIGHHVGEQRGFQASFGQACNPPNHFRIHSAPHFHVQPSEFLDLPQLDLHTGSFCESAPIGCRGQITSVVRRAVRGINAAKQVRNDTQYGRHQGKLSLSLGGKQITSP
jgi:hypothetical protein